MRTVLLVSLFGIILFSSPLATFAQDAKCVPGQDGVSCPLPDINFSGPSFFIDLINRVANWMFTFLLVIAVVFIIAAAYKYMFSGGGEETAAAHKMLIYAAVAVAVALLSRGFVYVIKQVVGDTVPAGQQAPPENVQDPNNQVLSDAEPVAQYTALPVNSSTIGGKTYGVASCPSGKVPGVGAVVSGSQITWSGYNNLLQQDPNRVPYTTLRAGGQSGADTAYTQFCDDTDGTIPEVTVNGVSYYSRDEQGTRINNLKDISNMAERLVQYVVVPGTPIAIKVQKCPDGENPGVQYDNQTYADNPNIGPGNGRAADAGTFYAVTIPEGKQFSVEICNNGAHRRAKIGGVEYPASN